MLPPPRPAVRTAVSSAPSQLLSSFTDTYQMMVIMSFCYAPMKNQRKEKKKEEMDKFFYYFVFLVSKGKFLHPTHQTLPV